MNLFLLWMRRKAPITLLLILLLTIGTAFGSVGVCALTAANRQTETVAQIYTTVAIPYDPEWLGRTPVESFEYRKDGSSPARYYDLEGILADAPVSIQSCPAVPLQGIIPDSVNVKAADFDSAFAGHGYSVTQWPDYTCVAGVRCDSVTSFNEERIYTSWDGDTMTGTWTEKEKRCSYVFSVVDPICMPVLSENELPTDTFELLTGVFQKDGSPLFEKGKTYLIRGRIMPVKKLFDGTEDEAYAAFSPINNDGHLTSEEVHENGWVWWTYTGDLPVYAAYTGDAETFLNSEEGRLWREKVIPDTERNHHCVMLLATDSVESLAPFCLRQADLIEGRTYTAEEARTGAKVCLISAAWAEKNGVSVGDVLPISVYAPKIEVVQFVGTNDGPGFAGPDKDEALLQMYPSYEQDAVGQTSEYEIIGIYACPPSDLGSLRFGPDTVLIPKSSVENADRYRTEEMIHYPLLNPYLLPNGAQNDLEAWLSERGLSGRFLYFDYGFSIAEDAIGQMTENGSRLFLTGLGAFVLSLLLFMLMQRLLLARSIRSMRLLGLNSAAVRRSFARTIPLWSVPAVLLGGVLSRIGYAGVTEKLLSSALAFDYGIAGLTVLAELIVICTALWLNGMCASKVRLMRGGRK